MTPSEMVDFVYTLQETELRTLNALVIDRLRDKRRASDHAATFAVRIGARVKWLGRAGKGIVGGHLGTVLEVGRTRVSVRFDGDPRSWRCPAAQLQVVDGPPELGADSLIDAITKPKEKKA